MADELNLDPRTKVRLKSIDIELLEGNLEETPWLIEDKDKNYILFEEKQYDRIILFLKKILEENLDYEIEARIMNEFPIDFEDVKLVVKKEMEDNNLSVDNSIKKVKRDYPDLFHKLEIEDFLSNF